tara:strand:+ start:173 stop:439 length:267 start_codon:yes stop_codon:yes gene_type:complete
MEAALVPAPIDALWIGSPALTEMMRAYQQASKTSYGAPWILMTLWTKISDRSAIEPNALCKLQACGALASAEIPTRRSGINATVHLVI